MIFSSTIAGVDQSIRRSTRKPRLNQDENRCTKSSSTARRSSRWPSTSISCSRMRTSAAVPPGARLSRRNSSCRRGSEAACTSAAVSSLGLSRQAAIAASMRAGSVPKRCASASKKAMRGPVVSSRVAAEDFARERDTGGFAAAGQQILAQLDQAFGAGRTPRRAGRARGRAARGRARKSSAAVRRKTRCSSQAPEPVRTAGSHRHLPAPIRWFGNHVAISGKMHKITIASIMQMT